MENQKMTANEFFKSIQIIHLALMAGPMMMGIMAFYFHYSGLEMDGGEEMKFALTYVVPFFTLAGVVASHFVFKQRLKDCMGKPSLKQKLNNYRSALIIKFALVEGSLFFAIVAYFLVDDLLFLGFAGLLILVFVAYRPTKEKAVMDLELNRSERQLIDDPNAVIQ